MEPIEKAIRTMARVADRAENQEDPNPGGMYGHEWLYHDAADTIAGLFDQAEPKQQEAMQRHSQRAADAIWGQQD